MMLPKSQNSRFTVWRADFQNPVSSDRAPNFNRRSTMFLEFSPLLFELIFEPDIWTEIRLIWIRKEPIETFP
jgi:hypothetical protein